MPPQPPKGGVAEHLLWIIGNIKGAFETFFDQHKTGTESLTANTVKKFE